MNSNDNQNWQRRLQELDVEVNRNSSTPSPTSVQLNSPVSPHSEAVEETPPSLEMVVTRFIAWFNGLPSAARVVVLLGGVVVGFIALKTLFQLVVSVVSLTILAGMLYAVYKVFMNSQSPKSD